MRKLTYQEFEERETKRHRGKYKYYHDYENCMKKIKITCLGCGETFYQTPNGHSNGRDCPNCNKISKRLTCLEFEKKAKKVHGEGKYRYYHDYENCMKKIKITCLGCGETFYQTPHNHSNGQGCPNCGGTKKLTIEQFEELATKLHDGKYQYHHDYIDMFTKIKITCLGCGLTFYQTPAHHIHNEQGCPNCAASKNERLTGEILHELFPNNIDESTFHNLTIVELPSGKTAQIDFKFEINGQIIFVEYHGVQHYGPVEFFGGKERYEIYQIPRDIALREYCKSHDILLFEIDGRKFKGKKIKEEILRIHKYLYAKQT